MCGIAGVYKIKSRNTQTLKSEIKRMTDQIAHRGPDDEGFFVEKKIALGHRRLSIIDLSPAGHQPMFSFNKNLVIVFNGEIYNYLEIREELQLKGYKFKSGSDTEVILAAFEEWGKECLSRFNGMWAFVIYNRKDKSLFGARDRLGVKPLYYLKDKEKFLFASEIKAILAYPEIKPKPNERIIWDFLVTGLIDHSHETMFSDISELRGGHYFIFKNGKLTIKKYWDLSETIKSIQNNYSYRFRNLLTDSIRLRLRSDVPIGSCLSGGLDSSSVVCLVNQFLKEGKTAQIGKWQKTFSAIYGQKNSACDESLYINEVIKKTQAKPYFVKPTGKKLAKEIRKLIWYQDLPFTSTSMYAQFDVFRLASNHKVKVMLDGQGADELLAGYPSFFGIYFSELIRQGKLIRLIFELYFYKKIHRQPILAVFKNLGLSLLKHKMLGGFLKKLNKNSLEFQIFESSWIKKYQSSISLPPRKNLLLQNASYYFLTKTSLPSLLRYEDRNSMAFAIESRVPFLDYRLVEAVYSMPDDQKIRNGQTKWVMRQGLRRILPSKILSRQDKIGFATPEEDWLKKDLKKDMQAVFNSKSFKSRGYFRNDSVNRLFSDYLTGKIKTPSIFWRLYCLELWFRIFIDEKKDEKSP